MSYSQNFPTISVRWCKDIGVQKPTVLARHVPSRTTFWDRITRLVSLLRIPDLWSIDRRQIDTTDVSNWRISVKPLTWRKVFSPLPDLQVRYDYPENWIYLLHPNLSVQDIDLANQIPWQHFAKSIPNKTALSLRCWRKLGSQHWPKYSETNSFLSKQISVSIFSPEDEVVGIIVVLVTSPDSTVHITAAKKNETNFLSSQVTAWQPQRTERWTRLNAAFRLRETWITVPL